MNAVSIIEGHIPWQPIDDMPEDRKNGRNMLLWFGAGYPAICNWDGAWCDAVGFVLTGAEAWADVEGPETNASEPSHENRGMVLSEARLSAQRAQERKTER